MAVAAKQKLVLRGRSSHLPFATNQVVLVVSAWMQASSRYTSRRPISWLLAGLHRKLAAARQAASTLLRGDRSLHHSRAVRSSRKRELTGLSAAARLIQWGRPLLVVFLALRTGQESAFHRAPRYDDDDVGTGLMAYACKGSCCNLRLVNCSSRGGYSGYDDSWSGGVDFGGTTTLGSLPRA